MKWTLWILSCLYVGVYQQQSQEHRLYLPFYYYQPQISRYSNQGPYLKNLNRFVRPSDYDFIPAAELESSINPPIMGEYESNESTQLLLWAQQAQPRVLASLTNNNNKSWLKKKNKVSTHPIIDAAQQEGNSVRLFNYLYGGNWLSLLSTSTTTTFLLTTVTSTMTTFTIKSCATSTQFISPITACRRRRNADLIAEVILLDDRVHLSPAQVQTITVSVSPPPILSLQNEYDYSHPLTKTEIESSHLEIEKPNLFVDHHHQHQQREKRFNRVITMTSSTTLTFTTYSMTTTTFTTSITLGAETAVSCLPSGITVC